MRPDYVAIFPGWYTGIAGVPGFRGVHRVSITDNLIAAGDTLIIYQTPWAARR